MLGVDEGAVRNVIRAENSASDQIEAQVEAREYAENSAPISAIAALGLTEKAIAGAERAIGNRSAAAG